MDTQHTITATTETTTEATAATAAPTLAELLQQRAEELADHERENARREQLSRENDRAEAMDSITAWLRDHISPALADALRATPAVDDSRLDEDPDDYGPEIASYLQLDVDGDPWTLSHDHAKYVGYHWRLRGPNEYSVNIGDVYRTDEKLDARLLDAIAAYPAWLAGADERRAAQAEKERRKQERQAEKRPTLRRYTSIVGGRNGGMLDRGNRIEVRAFNPWAENGFMSFAASVVEYSDTWLLLNIGTRQRLIPVAQVIDIDPLPDLAPEDGE